MNIDCTKWRELASDYIEGTLPADMNQAVTIHLRGCAICRQDEAALRAINRELNVLPEVEPPLFFRENVMSAIERQGTRPVGAWWEWLWTGQGRLAVGTSLTAAVAAIVALAVFVPKADHSGEKQVAGISTTSGIGTEPSTVTPVTSHLPELHIARVTTVLPGTGEAWDFSFHLENAPKGTARFQLGGDSRTYRFNMDGTAPQTLRIPAATIKDKKVLELHAEWSAEESAHTRYLFVPVPNEDGQPDVRQSFGLPEYNVTELAKEIATRYAQPVIVEDVPTNLSVRLTARNETAEETLRSTLSPLGLEVVATADGLHIRKAGENVPSKP